MVFRACFAFVGPGGGLARGAGREDSQVLRFGLHKEEIAVELEAVGACEGPAVDVPLLKGRHIINKEH